MAFKSTVKFHKKSLINIHISPYMIIINTLKIQRYKEGSFEIIRV